MANYDGADKRLARLFCPEYKTTEQLVGKWIDGSDLYQTSYSVQITNAESESCFFASSGLGGSCSFSSGGVPNRLRICLYPFRW